MHDWQPSTEFETELTQAFQAGDEVRYLTLLCTSEFALPITEAAAAGTEAPAWATFAAPDRVWVLAFTSIEAMRVATNGVATHCRVATLADLAAGWPDQQWGLAINPDLPTHFFFESSTIARLAAPSLSVEMAGSPAAEAPVVQKLLRPDDLLELLGESSIRASGYVHRLEDVAHIATPSVLLSALGMELEPDYLTSSGSVNLLRWPVAGPDLYRSPYGGLDEAGRDAVQGWLVEEPPFIGLGFGRNADQLIREYKVCGVGLPHGAEIWELNDDGAARRRAILDADIGRWMLVQRVEGNPTDDAELSRSEPDSSPPRLSAPPRPAGETS